MARKNVADGTIPAFEVILWSIVVVGGLGLRAFASPLRSSSLVARQMVTGPLQILLEIRCPVLAAEAGCFLALAGCLLAAAGFLPAVACLLVRANGRKIVSAPGTAAV